MTDRELMQMALEALQESKPIDIDDPAAFYRSAHAIEALRVALAQAEQEPVACIVKGCSNHRHEGKFVGDLCDPCHTFITTGEGKYSQAYRNSQREWLGLTDEEFKWIVCKNHNPHTQSAKRIRQTIKEIEDTLKEKNT